MNGNQKLCCPTPFHLLAIAVLVCSASLLQPIITIAQTVAGNADATNSDLKAQSIQYRSVIYELAKIESQIFELNNSKDQREFDQLAQALVELHAKRRRLADLEQNWELLADGTPALEVEPALNMSESTERRMLLELESSRADVLRLRTKLMRLNSEFGPGHPEILDTTRKLAELDSVVKDQTEALEDLGVEVKSSVAKQKLKDALLRREELKAKFGSGHPRVINVESEIVMLRAEVSDTPTAPAPHAKPSIELVDANLQLQDAASKFGTGHPVFRAIARKVQMLEELAQSEAKAEAPINKLELAKRLESRIQTLQDKILDQETELDLNPDKRERFKAFEKKTAELLQKREELNRRLQGFSSGLLTSTEIKEDQRAHLSKQLLGGIEALEALGKPDEAQRLREILSGLGR